MSNSKMKVVLFWVDSEKVSTEEMEIVNCEDRYVGAPTTVTYGKESFRAIVRLISSEYYFYLFVHCSSSFKMLVNVNEPKSARC